VSWIIIHIIEMCDTWVKFNAKNTAHKNMIIKYRDQYNFNRIEFIVTDVKKLWHQLVIYQELIGICEVSFTIILLN
jgi:hypothetical protein